MTLSTLRIQFEAWANRRFLNSVAITENPAKLAAGVLMFMAFRRMLSRHEGSDYLQALPSMSKVERARLLKSIKTVYVQMFVAETQLRKVHGDAHYEQVCGGAEPDPFAHRLAASMALQLISAYAVPSARHAAAACLENLAQNALPEMPAAFHAARAALDAKRNMADAGDTPVDDILGHVAHITLEDLEQPLAPALTWLPGLRADQTE